MRRFVIILFSILLVILQLYLSPVIAIAGYSPDFIIILLVILAAKESLLTLLCTGIVAGMVIDLTTAGGTFINTIVYLISSLICGLYRYVRLKDIEGVNVAIYTLVCAVLKYFILMFALYIIKIQLNFSIIIFFVNIPAMIYSVIIAMPLFYLYFLIGKLKFMQPPKEERHMMSGWFIR